MAGSGALPGFHLRVPSAGLIGGGLFIPAGRACYQSSRREVDEDVNFLTT